MIYMTENKASTAQIKCIKAIMGKLKLPDGDALVLGFSGMRTGHVSELTVPEAIGLTKHLKALDPDEPVAERMRRKIIGMAYGRAGLGRTASPEQKRKVVDWLDGWCKQYGHKHKALNSYTRHELTKLVTQFELVLKDILIKI
jgi:hypothetical protein